VTPARAAYVLRFPATLTWRMTKNAVPPPPRPSALSATLASAARASEMTRPGESEVADATGATREALAFEQVYASHFSHVCRWARALGGLDADLDDLAQEVFLVVRRRLHEFDGPSFGAWLYGITRKTVSDYRRRAWFRRWLGGTTRSLDHATSQAQLTHQDRPERAEARRIVRQVLERMSPVRRTAFILFELEGYTGEEIAELQTVPVGTVYTRLHHARKDFARMAAALTKTPRGGDS